MQIESTKFRGVSYFLQSLLSLNRVTISTSCRTVVFSSVRERFTRAQRWFSSSPDKIMDCRGGSAYQGNTGLTNSNRGNSSEGGVRLSKRTLGSKDVRLIVFLGVLSVASVVGVASVLSYECQANGYCLAPFTPNSTSGETLNLDRYTIATAPSQSNPTVLNMWIRNTGSTIVSISSLSIRDLTSGGSSVSFQTPVSISPGATRNLAIDTHSSEFYFTSGHSYSFIVVTSKNNQFTFSASY
jgi:hypothetical protein